MTDPVSSNPVFSLFPDATWLVPLVVVYLLDGLVLYTTARGAHAMGLPWRSGELDPPAGDGMIDAEWLRRHGDTGAVTLSDGAVSVWTARAAYGAAYNGIFHGMARTKKRIGVTSTIVLERAADGGLTYTKRLRLGPLVVALALPLLFLRTSIPELPLAWALIGPAVALLVGPVWFVYKLRCSDADLDVLFEAIEAAMEDDGGAPE
jgi:hypothetical protein